MRLIDADALKKEFPKDTDWEYPANTNEYVCEKIDAQPTVQPETNCSEIPNNSDVISRQAAIDEAEKWFFNLEDKRTVGEVLKALPPVQPDIIRCKDCKWYGRADKRRFYRGMDCLQKRIDTIVPDRDFCSRAERKKNGL